MFWHNNSIEKQLKIVLSHLTLNTGDCAGTGGKRRQGRGDGAGNGPGPGNECGSTGTGQLTNTGGHRKPSRRAGTK
jgi:hypothetical protein